MTEGGGWAVPGLRHVRELGSGASGRVVLAVHEQSGQQVAVKYLAPRMLGDRRFVERFREEARLLAGLTDPNLVRFFDYVESADGAAIVMEFVPGASLRAILDQQRALEPEAALALLKGSLLGLAAAHGARVVHRDYKPENVLVPEDGASKLADFGIAVPVGGDAAFAGTPAYMAPEQWASGAVSPATDVYAATVVFFECLAGAKPYQGTTLDEWARAHQAAPVPVQGVPEPVRQLVAHGMAKNPAERPVSAAAFVTELETAARAAYGEDWEARGRRRLAALVAALLALVPSQLTDLPPGDQAGQQALNQADTAKGLFSKLSQPALVVPAAGMAVLAVVIVSVLVVRPWEPKDTESRTRPSPTEFRTPTEPPPGDDVIVIIPQRMETLGTASFSYEQIGCCANQTWAWGDLDTRSPASSVHLRKVFNGTDAAYLKGRDPNYRIFDPEAKARVDRTRAYAVADQSYANLGGGWRSYTTSSSRYKNGENPDSTASRYKDTARSAFHTRAAVSSQHIEALLAGGDASPSLAEGGSVVYKGSTTIQAAKARYPGLAEVYGAASTGTLNYTLVLGPDYLPRELDVRWPTPGTNVPYWQYEVKYSGWGEGDPIEPPGEDAEASDTPTPEAESPGTPVPSAATSRAP